MKVSIITVTFNRAGLIGETIQSVRDQTHADFEHLIIDDGSTDSTEQVVNSFQDSRIRYFKQPHTANLSRLHNYGLTQATGDLIAVLDSDDIWLPEKLESAVRLFSQNPDIKILLHNIQYFNAQGIRKPYYKNTESFHAHVLSEVLTFKILPFPIVIFRKEITDRIGYLNPSFPDGQQDFLFRVASEFPIYFTGHTLTRIRLHADNMHRSIKNIPYFTNYYRTVPRLFLRGKVPFRLFARGMCLNTFNLCKHLAR